MSADFSNEFQAAFRLHCQHCTACKNKHEEMQKAESGSPKQRRLRLEIIDHMRTGGLTF